VQEILHLLHVPHHLEPAGLGITTAVLGAFYLLLLHVPTFRRAVGSSLGLGWFALRSVVFDLPMTMLRLPAVRHFLDSFPYLIFMRYVLKPLPAAALTWAVLCHVGIDSGSAALAGVIVLLAVSALVNSRLGRDLEEIATDWFAHRWEHLRGLVPGLFRLLADFFKGILEAVDRCLYTVDEWLRFRSGQGRCM